jgi:hypothetical protein
MISFINTACHTSPNWIYHVTHAVLINHTIPTILDSNLYLQTLFFKVFLRIRLLRSTYNISAETSSLSSQARFSRSLFSPPESGYEPPASTRPNKLRKAHLSTREHALALTAALTTKILERIDGWPQTGLKADLPAEQRASIKSYLPAKTEAAASKSLDKVSPLAV